MTVSGEHVQPGLRRSLVRWGVASAVVCLLMFGALAWFSIVPVRVCRAELDRIGEPDDWRTWPPLRARNGVDW